MTGKKAVIVGAGLGGLAAGIALRRRGWEIAIVERAAELREGGAGISLWPNAVRALDLLGLGDAVRELGVIEAAAGFRTASGRWLFRSDIDALDRLYGQTVMIRRPVLLDILKNALPADAVVLDAEASQVSSIDGQVTVTHARGEETGDLLIGADGIRSTVRSRLWPDAKPPVYAGYTTWRFVTPPLDLQSEVSESWGRGERVGIFAIGDGSIYSYLSASVPSGGQFRDEHAELLRRFGRWHDPIPAILDSVGTADILRNDIYRLPPLASYVTTRTALIGDAAHAMTPDMGQGGCTALEDAFELAECLDRTTGIAAGLQEYDHRRRRRTQSIARQSALFGSFAQVSARPAVAVRNALFRLLPPAALYRSLRPVLSWPNG